MILRIGEELEKHHEKAESLVLLDELVAKVDDDQAARTDLVLQADRVVDVLAREFEPRLRHVLQVVGQRRGFDSPVNPSSVSSSRSDFISG